MPYVLKAEELETRANKVTILTADATNDQYPSAKAVIDALKNGGGTVVEVDSELSLTSENPVQNKVITAELEKIPVKSAKTKGFYIYSSDIANKTFYLSSAPVQYNADGSKTDRIWTSNDADAFDAWFSRDVYFDGKQLSAYEKGKDTQFIAYDIGVSYTFLSRIDIEKSNDHSGQLVLDILPEYVDSNKTTKLTDESFETRLKADKDFIAFAPLSPSYGTVLLYDDQLQHGTASAVGKASVAVGRDSKAIGNYSFVAGRGNTAGYGATALGFESVAYGNHSMVAGTNCTTGQDAQNAFAQGWGTEATGHSSVAEGYVTKAQGNYSHAEGTGSTASAVNSHAEGNTSTASGNNSHSEGRLTVSGGENSHAEGYGSKVEAGCTNGHAEGSETKVLGAEGHAEGALTTAYRRAHAEGLNTIAETYSHAEGIGTHSIGQGSHAEGNGTIARGESSHAEGVSTVASGKGSHAEGLNNTQATAQGAHAEGNATKATAANAHSEGNSTTASGSEAHAEGWGTTASGPKSHAEGHGSQALGKYSHAEGLLTIAKAQNQHVSGKYNLEDPAGAAEVEGTYVHIVGNGKNGDNRSNAYTLDWAGNGRFAGDLYVGSADKDKGLKVATEDFVRNNSSKVTVDTSLSTNSSNPIANKTVATKFNNIETYVFDVNQKTEELSAKMLLLPEIRSGDGSNSARLGIDTIASGNNSFAQGETVTIYESALDRDVTYQLEATATAAHAEGQGTKANGVASHTEGFNTQTTANRSHAEGGNTSAHAEYSHVEGIGTTAGTEGESTLGHVNYIDDAGLRARAAHAEGVHTVAKARGAHSEGLGTIAASQYQHVQGQYNVEDNSGKYLHIVGNGTGPETENRHNAYTLDTNGNATFAGNTEATNGRFAGEVITNELTVNNHATIDTLNYRGIMCELLQFEITYEGESKPRIIKVLGAEVTNG